MPNYLREVHHYRMKVSWQQKNLLDSNTYPYWEPAFILLFGLDWIFCWHALSLRNFKPIPELNILRRSNILSATFVPIQIFFLPFYRKQFDASVSFLDIEVNEIDPRRSKIFSSSSYHVGSVDLISRTRELAIASALLFETEEAQQVLPGANRPDTLPFLPDESTVDQDIADFPESVDDPIDQLPRPSGLPRSAPFTESFVDANLPGGIYEKTPFIGFSIEMAGTYVFPLCCKADTPAGNTTESEMDAANRNGKSLRWMRLYMEDIRLPFEAPIPSADDNSATRVIAHTGKITRNTRHIALKTLSLQI
jgi:hypothetical protein